MSEDIMIAPAKLEIPAYPPAFVERPLLMDHMRHLMHQKMTCIVAPLGSGKTCALAEFARRQMAKDAQDPHRVAWLSVDERDNDSQRFWAHVFAAIAQGARTEDFDEATLEMLKEPVSLELIERAATMLFESQELANTILLLDGIDRVHDVAIEEQLLHFIIYAPKEFRVFVTARRLSDTMQSGSYRLGQLQLHYHDLLLSHVDVRRVLEVAPMPDIEAEIMSDAPLASILSEADFQNIIDLTEGWPQGVSAAEQTLVSCAQRGYAYSFSGASTAVRRYFDATVASVIPEGLVFAFKVLSLFERFSKSLFKTVFAAYPEIRDCFDDVVSSGSALVIACDDQGEWYRFNHLFADWIRHGFRSNERHAIRRACLIASEWFNEKGFVDEAAKCLLMSVDFAYVSSIVEATSGLKSNMQDEDAFVWVSYMPSARFQRSPLLSLLSAWSYNAIGRIKDAERWMETFREAAANSPKLLKEDADLAIKHLEAKHLAMIGDNQLALKLNEELIVAAHAKERSLSSMLYQSIGEANERLGNLKVAEEMFLQAQASASVDNTEHHLYFNMFSYAKIRFDLGDFDECESTCRKLLEVCPDEFVFRVASYALLALVHVERNEMNEAKIDVEGSLKEAIPYQNIDMYLLSKIAQSTYVAAQGDHASAYEIISEAVMHGEQTIVPKNVLLSAYFKQSEIAMRRGNERELQIIERKFKMRADTLDDYHRIMYLMLKGACLLQQGKLKAGLASYAEAAECARELNAAYFEAKALVELLVSGDDKSLPNRGALLNRLIYIVDSHGFVRVLLNAGAPMRDLLRKYSSASHVNAQTRQFVKGILVLFERELHGRSIADVQNAHIGKLDNLTSREREVLGLLNMGMSRKEIADALCVSINTAKKHLSNIYAKLGAQSRDQVLDAINESIVSE